MTWFPARAVAYFISLFVLLIYAPAFSTPAIPSTPAGEAFAAWLSAFNAGGMKQAQAFKGAYKSDVQIDDLLAARWAIGGYDLLRIERNENTSLVALLKERDSDRAVRMEVSVKTAEGVPALRIEGQFASLPTEFAPARLPLDTALSALSRRARDLCAADRFAGGILVARGDKILLQQSCGWANRETKTAVTVETQFRAGSLNKMFTAVAVLQLVQRGKVTLGDSVGSILVDYPNKEVASKVTVRHLLTHTAGLGDIFGPEFDNHRAELKEHRDYIKLYGERAPDREAATKAQYSNYGYVILGAIIEKVSGTSYYDFVRANIFERAGMVATDSLPESVTVPRRAPGYRREADAWVSNADTLPVRGTAAGGGYTTVGDLLRFVRALQTGKLISPRMLDEATRPQIDDRWYGYGFLLQGEGETRSYGHGGGAPGMNADLRVFPDLGYVLIGLSNLDPPAASRIVEYFSVRMPN